MILSVLLYVALIVLCSFAVLLFAFHAVLRISEDKLSLAFFLWCCTWAFLISATVSLQGLLGVLNG